MELPIVFGFHCDGFDVLAMDRRQGFGIFINTKIKN
jgi:hypothetical protein